jgi:hypothetical protein
MPNEYGVTRDGFVLKPIDVLVAEQDARAREMFGEEVDLTPGSPIRKLLDAVAWHDHELWQALEGQYYANFVSTAGGASLDLLGEDVGVQRRRLFGRGEITWKLAGGDEPDRSYSLPEGTLLETAAGDHCRTLTRAVLTVGSPTATATAEGLERGVDIQPGPLTIPQDVRTFALDLGSAQVTASSAQPFTGGQLLESDADYRSRMIALPRNTWTLERVRRAVKDLDPVRDCLVFDPLGGVDVSQSYFNTFRYGERAFAQDRPLASPYYFDVVVATWPGWPWHDRAGIRGTYTRVIDAIRELRPVSIFPNVIAANQVEIGLRATLRVTSGHDRDAILAAIRSLLRRYVGDLSFGYDVRFSDVMVLVRRVTGVVDVQDLHLRRCPATFSGINLGGGQFRQLVELPQGANVQLAPDEIPYFSIDSRLVDIEVTAR